MTPWGWLLSRSKVAPPQKGADADTWEKWHSDLRESMAKNKVPVGVLERKTRVLNQAASSLSISFLSKVHAWFLALKAPISGIQRWEYLYNPTLNKAVVLLGERHRTLQHGTLSQLTSFPILFQALSPTKIDFMVEDGNPWVRPAKRLHDRLFPGDTELTNLFNGLVHPCLPEFRDSHPSECSPNVKYSWLDPYLSLYTRASPAIHAVKWTEMAGQKRNMWPADIRSQVRTEQELNLKLLGAGRSASEADKKALEEATELATECKQAGIKADALLKMWHESKSAMDPDWDWEESARVMQRFTQDAYTLCRILKPAKTPGLGWGHSYIVLTGMNHTRRLLPMLQQYGFERYDPATPWPAFAGGRPPR